MARRQATVPPELDGVRADRVVAAVAGVSRGVAKQLIEGGAVRIDGRVPTLREPVGAGATVDVDVPDHEETLVAEEVPFGVAYEDDDVIVVDKPPGVVVHPGAGNRTGTLAAGLLARYPDLEALGEERRWGIVHRLDKDTSGLLMVARTPEAFDVLQRALKARKVGRTYLTLVHGVGDATTGTIEAPLGRDPRRPTRVAVRRDGRPAVTHYRRLAAWHDRDVALLEVQLETGRTHQIRVHLRAIGHPVVGDPTYGSRAGGREADYTPGRVWLHAARLIFPHPRHGGEVVVRAPLPADLRGSLARLGPPDEGEIPADAVSSTGPEE